MERDVILGAAARLAILVLGAPAMAAAVSVDPQAPEGSPPVTQGAIPEADFETTFRKFALDNDYGSFYAWDASLGMRVVVLRRGGGAVAFRGVIQAVGTRNFGSRVGVGGTGYLLTIVYVHRTAGDVTLSAGVTHLSSHLTRDLDEKVEEERNRGAAIPIVVDPGEYNVPFVRAQRRFRTLRFTPELDVIVAPVNFRFGGGRHGHVRPVYVGSTATLWREDRTSVLAATQHELGRNSFHHFSLIVERQSSSPTGGRVQLVMTAAPGRTLHVSPHVGGVRDGVAVGVRFAFPR